MQDVQISKVSDTKTEYRQIPIALPSVGEEEWQATKDVFTSGWLTQGPKVAKFEKKFAEYINSKYSFAVTSCTTGLHLALAALDIGPGDEVLVPSFTWVASANAVLYCGATPVLVDINLDTFNIDPKEIQKKLTPKTKAIMAVHLFGLCADMDAIKEAAPGIPIIEDAACAAGAKYKDLFAGTLGTLASFSFHPRKSITTGEGGMVTTNNENLANKLNILRNHGASISEEKRHLGPKPYILPDFETMGFNYRMTDLQGAVGIVQLHKLNNFIEERDKWANFYIDSLKDIPWITTPNVPKNYHHGWQSFVVLIDEEKAPLPRNKIMELLQEKGISTRPGTHAVHMLDFYIKKYILKPEDYPNAKIANDCSMAIPLHNKMSPDDYHYIVRRIKEL